MSTSNTPANEPIKKTTDDTTADVMPTIVMTAPNASSPDEKQANRSRKPKPLARMDGSGTIPRLNSSSGDKKD